MKKVKKSPRQEFLDDCYLRNDIKRVAAMAWDAMQLASSHDPEHAQELKEFRRRLEKLEGSKEPRERYSGNFS